MTLREEEPKQKRIKLEDQIEDEPLLDLGVLTRGVMICRPSKRNKSPYVADVSLECGRVAIAHVPSLDMGGKCVAGSVVMMKPAVDRKGIPIGPDSLSKKYNTPKCEFIVQLLKVEDERVGDVWIGAHPKLGEKIAEVLMKRNILHPRMPRIESYEREVTFPELNMRSDFVLKPADGPRRIVCEVKTVVDCNRDENIPSYEEIEPGDKRLGIFPIGKRNQKGPNNEKVVSARAIKHLIELSSLACGRSASCKCGSAESLEEFDAAILFVISRHDVDAFRPNSASCPTFAGCLRDASDMGVSVYAFKVRWGDGPELGKCFADCAVPVEM